jgi:hypothetical protein
MMTYLLTFVLFAPAPAPAPMNPPITPGVDGVVARCTWQPAAAMRVGEKQYIFREGKQLAAVMQLKATGDVDVTATNLLAKQLRVENIDWKKQMVVTIAAGLRGADADRVAVTRIAQKDQTLTIYYTLYVDRPPQPGDNPMSPPKATGFGCPAETVLINRFDGPIKIQREDEKPKPMKE